jgi:hypothetical protein
MRTFSSPFVRPKEAREAMSAPEASATAPPGHSMDEAPGTPLIVEAPIMFDEQIFDLLRPDLLDIDHVCAVRLLPGNHYRVEARLQGESHGDFPLIYHHIDWILKHHLIKPLPRMFNNTLPDELRAQIETIKGVRALHVLTLAMGAVLRIVLDPNSDAHEGDIARQVMMLMEEYAKAHFRLI